ncbi:MAG: hypothetical protein RLY78_89 [Pseudomonadota bacterium]|jgi:hypothetical protein|uniref:DUF2789 family protein n=1 Tax=Pseudaquabacterium rugosum TaxID=2984194 RepID=A0ABU9BC78_9BURK
MHPHHHTMRELFDQLGLSSSPQERQRFIEAHRPLPPGQRLAAAPFWSAAQAEFLQQSQAEDSDWTILIDTLSVQLRRSGRA